MAVPSVPRFYGWAQLTYQATRGRSGTAPGRGHQRGQKGGKVWIRVPAPKRAQVGTFWPAGVPGVHPAPPPPQPNYEKGGVFQNVGGGVGAVDPGQGVHGWAAVQASVQRFQPGGIVSACGSIGAGPSRSRQTPAGRPAAAPPHRPALLLPMDPWRPVCQRRRLGAILGAGSGRSHARRRAPYGGGIPGPTRPPAPRIRPRAAGQGGGGRTGAGGPAYQYAPKN